MSRYVDLNSPRIVHIGRDKFGNGIYCIPPDLPTIDVPDINVEKLTDAEQRIFLASMGREEMVCKKVDIEMKCKPHETSLVSVCEEIERKVKKTLF